VGSTTYATASTSATATVPASYLADGPATRTVRATIVDKDGGTRTSTTAITVTNAAPTGAIANQTVPEGTPPTIALTGVPDASTVDRASLRYAYDLDGDGTFEVGSTTYANATTATSATFPATDGPATRTVHAAVVDKDGGFSAYTATITV